MNVAVLLAGLLIILGGAYLFTNGVEWVGKRLRLSEGVVGSILAGVGTAMPETMVPVMAIYFGNGESRQEVGIGAILGAPFMLTCLTLPLLGMGIGLLSWLGKRSPAIKVNSLLVRMDLGFFLCAYGIALAMALLASRGLVGADTRWVFFVAAGLLIGLYLHYLKKLLMKEGVIGEDLNPLIFARKRDNPHTRVILLQVAVGFVMIIAGAHLFVDGVQHLAQSLGVSPLILSLLITPIATELPEKLNSLIWISQRKDHLAIANITGAMVFQSTFPVAVGLTGTAWRLDTYGLVSAGMAILAALFLYGVIRIRGRWRPIHLFSGLIFYLGFIIILTF
ncbi:MAG TPA: sodium:calcium antiporter [Nitrospiria bacterium]